MDSQDLPLNIVVTTSYLREQLWGGPVHWHRAHLVFGAPVSDTSAGGDVDAWSSLPSVQSHV